MNSNTVHCKSEDKLGLDNQNPLDNELVDSVAADNNEVGMVGSPSSDDALSCPREFEIDKNLACNHNVVEDQLPVEALHIADDEAEVKKICHVLNVTNVDEASTSKIECKAETV